MRTGVLYRGDDPVRLTDEGRAHRRARTAGGHRPAPEGAVRPATSSMTRTSRTTSRRSTASSTWRTHPRFEETADIVGLYEDMVVRGGPQLVRAVDTVAEYIADGPVLVHCVAGKDRTGLVVALVQAALGVPRIDHRRIRSSANPRSDAARQ